MKNRKYICTAIFAACILASASLTACSSATVPSTLTVQSAENSGITVSGEEKIKVTPDIAEITYSVDTQETDAKACQEKNVKNVDTVISLLKEKGIDEKDIKTNDVGLNPIYDWNNGRKITGYEMTTEIVVSSVPIDEAGTIISDSVNAGINSIDSVQYQCSNFDELYAEALKNAITDARKKADIMAEAGGKKVVAMTQVQELSSGDQAVAYTATNSMKEMSVMNADSADAGTSMMPGQVEVEAEVSVTFSIE